jgi:hypothetical protein
MLTRMALRMGVAMLLVGPRADAQLSDRPLLIEARIPKPPTVVRFSDGRALVYEVHVTNFEPRELTWIGLQATDAATGAPLYALADTALWRDLVRPGATGTQITMGHRCGTASRSATAAERAPCSSLPSPWLRGR